MNLLRENGPAIPGSEREMSRPSTGLEPKSVQRERQPVKQPMNQFWAPFPSQQPSQISQPHPSQQPSQRSQPQPSQLPKQRSLPQPSQQPSQLPTMTRPR